jgi:hypothetical protein
MQNHLDRLPEQYATRYVDRSSDILIIQLSPSPHLTLQKYELPFSILYVADRHLTYYTTSPRHVLSIILDGCEAAGFRKVVFVGSSKGATGALLWSAIANGSRRKLRISCLAFSPQTLLYPHNENLAILPSYGRWAHSKNDENHHVKNFRFYGNIVEHMVGRTPQTVVYYSRGNKMDRLEVEPLEGMPGVTLVPMELPFHGSVMPFVTDVNDHKKLLQLTEKLYQDAQTDTDLAASLPDDPAQFHSAMAEMMGASLRDVIEQHVAQRRWIQDRWLRARNLVIRARARHAAWRSGKLR